jgi:3-oxoadipate enol-lactonase
MTATEETKTMFLHASGINLHVQIDGPPNAAPILLLHSLGTTLHVWDPQAASLARGLRVIRPDMRGHGLSEVTKGPYSIEGLARDALSVLDALGIDRVHVCGISIGGLIAQAVASLAPPRVISLMLCDTAMRIPPPEHWHQRAALVRTAGMPAIVDAVMARWVTPAFQTAPPALGLRAMLLRTDPEGYAAAAEAIAAADRTEATRALRLPTLVLVGALDAATPPSDAEALRDAIPGARLIVLENAAHIPTVEAPDAVNRALLDFVTTVSRDA